MEEKLDTETMEMIATTPPLLFGGAKHKKRRSPRKKRSRGKRSRGKRSRGGKSHKKRSSGRKSTKKRSSGRKSPKKRSRRSRGLRKRRGGKSCSSKYSSLRRYGGKSHKSHKSRKKRSRGRKSRKSRKKRSRGGKRCKEYVVHNKKCGRKCTAVPAELLCGLSECRRRKVCRALGKVYDSKTKRCREPKRHSKKKRSLTRSVAAKRLQRFMREARRRKKSRGGRKSPKKKSRKKKSRMKKSRKKK